MVSLCMISYNRKESGYSICILGCQYWYSDLQVGDSDEPYATHPAGLNSLPYVILSKIL